MTMVRGLDRLPNADAPREACAPNVDSRRLASARCAITAILVMQSCFVRTAVAQEVAGASMAPALGPWRCTRPLIAADGRFLYVERAQSIVVHDTIVALGNIAYVYDAPRIARVKDLAEIDSTYGRSVAGAIVPLHGTPAALELPVGTHRLGWPQLVSGTGDTVHVVWSELDTAHTESLWYARLLHGLWSVPERIADGVVGWAGTAGRVLPANDGSLIVVAPHLPPRHGGGILVARRRAGTWTARTIDIGYMPAYVDVALSRDGLVLVYIGHDTVNDRNSVFAVRLGPRDELGSPLLVRRSGRGAAWQPELEQLGRTLHVLWRDELPDVGAPTQLAHWWSADDGASWTGGPPLPTGPLQDALVLRRNERSLDVLLHGPDGRLRTSSWAGTWSRPVDTDISTSAAPGWVALTDSSVALLFTRKQRVGIVPGVSVGSHCRGTTARSARRRTSDSRVVDAGDEPHRAASS